MLEMKGKKNRARQKWDEEICVENDG